MKYKMFILFLERRWKLHNFSSLPFAPPEVRLGQHLQFKLLFPEVNNSAVRFQSQFNIWQSCYFEIIPLEHTYNTFSQRVSEHFNTLNCVMVCFIHRYNTTTLRWHIVSEWRDLYNILGKEGKVMQNWNYRQN